MFFADKLAVVLYPKKTKGLCNSSSKGIEISFSASSIFRGAEILVKSPRIEGTFTLS